MEKMTKRQIEPHYFFQKYMPLPSVNYTMMLWKKYGFSLKISKTRISKFGDYRYEYATKKHTITINADLNPYAFLITYLHEVAHLKVNIEHGSKVVPHGPEWKHAFRDISQPMLNDTIFPPKLLNVLKTHLQNPKASSCSDQVLFKLLSSYDAKNDKPILADIGMGITFQLNNRLFIKGERKRSRTLCTELSTGRRFLISNVARVQVNF